MNKTSEGIICTACNKPKNEWGPNCTSEVKDGDFKYCKSCDEYYPLFTKHEHCKPSDHTEDVLVKTDSKESWGVELYNLLTDCGIKPERKIDVAQFFLKEIQAERQKVILDLKSKGLLKNTKALDRVFNLTNARKKL